MYSSMGTGLCETSVLHFYQVLADDFDGHNWTYVPSFSIVVTGKKASASPITVHLHSHLAVGFLCMLRQASIPLDCQEHQN